MSNAIKWGGHLLAPLVILMLLALPVHATNRAASVDHLALEAAWNDLNTAARLYGPGHANLLTPLIQMANTYLEAGRISQAEPLLQQAMNILEKRRGARSDEMLNLMRKMALIDWRRGRYRLAEIQLKNILKTEGRKSGHSKPKAFARRLDLARFYITAPGGERQALNTMGNHLDSLIRSQGIKHHLVALADTFLGTIHLGNNKLDKAKKHFKRALNSYEQGIGRRATVTAKAMQNLGRVMVRQGNHAQAALLFSRAIDIVERLDPKGDLLISLLHEQGVIYLILGQSSKAESILRQVLNAVNSLDKGMRRYPRQTLDALLCLGAIHWLRGEDATAKDLLSRASVQSLFVYRNDGRGFQQFRKEEGSITTAFSLPEEERTPTRKENMIKSLYRGLSQNFGTEEITPESWIPPFDPDDEIPKPMVAGRSPRNGVDSMEDVSTTDSNQKNQRGASGGFQVALGCFTQNRTVDRLEKGVMDLGLTVIMQEKMIRQRAHTCLITGPYETLNAAAKIERRLKQALRLKNTRVKRHTP